ncbi:hypothetical protein Daus18300_010083 [Diaporthe australafricana]|uniref:Uncharacterized protein n=1 Tax=Diaporthe australafricana TaxID=127596 RepID=A0ABR3WBF8_9PEZI
MRYSIHKRKLLKWKVWIAVDAEFNAPSDSKASPPPPDSTGADSDNSQAISVKQILEEPLTKAILLVFRRSLEEMRNLANAGEATGTGGTAEVTDHIPDEVDLEILVWDTVIPLRFNIRSGEYSTHWVGKIGERRPWKNSWFIIPIPFFFDF